ncbi:MAG: PEGA domain-containing protein [Myxococcota bacterium]
MNRSLLLVAAFGVMVGPSATAVVGPSAVRAQAPEGTSPEGTSPEGTSSEESPEAAPEPSAEQASATPQGTAQPEAAPVVVLAIPDERFTPPLAAQYRDLIVEQLRPHVRGREVRGVGSDDTMAAARACEEAPCLGALIAAERAQLGVLLYLARRTARADVTLRLEVIDPVSGNPNIEPIEATVPRDQVEAPAGLLAPLTAQIQTLMPRPPPATTLLITSNVEGAQVMFDDRPVGQTPLPPSSVSPGQHTIQLSRDGFTVTRRTFDVPRGQATRVNVTLEPNDAQQARDEAGEEVFGPVGGGSWGTEEEESVTSQWWFWAAVGGGAAILLGATIAIIAVAASGDDDPGQEAIILPPIN